MTIPTLVTFIIYFLVLLGMGTIVLVVWKQVERSGSNTRIWQIGWCRR